MNLRNKMRKNYFNTGFKLVVTILLMWVLYRQVFGREQIDELWQVFQDSLRHESLPFLVLCLLLMPVNWLFETWKWRVLIRRFEQQSLWQSYKAILVGVTFSIFTPNRIGEYGGRILLVRPKNNWKSVVATLVGSFAQLMVLLGMGFIGLITFMGTHWVTQPIWRYGMAGFGFVLVGVLLFAFYNVDSIIPLIKRIPYIRKVKRLVKDISVLKSYKHSELTHALWFAWWRYTTYLVQYYCLLRFFGITVPFGEAAAGIATIFLVQTSIPLPPLWDLLVRGELALQVWGLYQANELSVLAATFGLWIINLIIPALFGLLGMFNINVLKSIGYVQKNNKNRRV